MNDIITVTRDPRPVRLAPQIPTPAANEGHIKTITNTDAIITKNDRSVKLKLTIFKNVKPTPTDTEQVERSWDAVCDRLTNPHEFESKKSSQLLKLASFGDKLSAKGCTRADDNMLEVFGIEGDYDGEIVTIAQAQAMLECANIEAFIYSSPSHSTEKPRWRVLAPLSKPCAPADRATYVARLNGALGGILAVESFTQSQSYFFGKVKGMEYSTARVAGKYINTLALPEVFPLGKSADKPGKKTKAEKLADTSLNDTRAMWLHEHGKVLNVDKASGRLDVTPPFKPASGYGVPSSFSYFPRLTGGYECGHFKNLHSTNADWTDEQYCEAYGMPSVVDEFDVETTYTKILDDLPALAITDAGDKKLIQFPAPFQGVMSDVVEAALKSAPVPQPALTTLAALIGMAASCSGHYRLPSDGRLNLFGIGVASTGWGKDHPCKVAIAIAMKNNARIIGRAASGQGLEDALENHRAMLTVMDEFAHVMSAINDPKAPGYTRDLAANILKLFSNSNGVYHTRQKAASKHEPPSRMVVHPCLNLIAFATPEKLGEAMSVSNIEDGLMGRLLFASGQGGVAQRRGME